MLLSSQYAPRKRLDSAHAPFSVLHDSPSASRRRQNRFANTFVLSNGLKSQISRFAFPSVSAHCLKLSSVISPSESHSSPRPAVSAFSSQSLSNWAEADARQSESASAWSPRIVLLGKGPESWSRRTRATGRCALAGRGFPPRTLWQVCDFRAAPLLIACRWILSRMLTVRCTGPP